MFRKLASSAYHKISEFGRRRDESLPLQLGALQAQSLKSSNPTSISEAEFKVFSQWGEDGIIQHLVNSIPSIRKTFVEFGVDDYSESNTRFLLMNNFWNGLIIDGGDKHSKFLRKQRYDWRYRIQTKTSFITAENINELISSAGFSGELGLLSVDLDGVDYWVLEAISVVQPTIVIVEYNGFFGPKHAVTIPYRADFRRHLAHHSNFYWGASLAAFYHQLTRRGYFFVGCNSAGNNAFFVSRESKHSGLQEVSLDEGYCIPSFWEYRQPNGELDRSRDVNGFFRAIAELPLVDVANGIERTVGDFRFQ